MPTNYRAAVGPEENYDILGAHQFMLLVMLGLREKHKLLDIGCGSLRAGRFFIPYLNPKNYYGLEPDAELVRAGMNMEIGMPYQSNPKRPRFLHNDQFDFSHWRDKGIKFDYVLAQSIFSHTPPALLKKCLGSLTSVIHPDTVFAFTYFSGRDTFVNSTEWIGRNNGGVVHYTYATIRYKFSCYDWYMRKIAWKHPSGQTWCIATRNYTKLENMTRRLREWSGQIYRS